MSLSIIHIAWGVRILFLFEAEYSIVCIHHILSVHLFNRHLGCLHLLAVVNNAAVNIVVQEFESLFSFLLGLYLGVDAESCVKSVFNFLRNCRTFPQQLHQGSSFSMSSPTLVTFPFYKIYNSHPNGCEVIFVISFLKSPISDFYFLDLLNNYVKIPWWWIWKLLLVVLSVFSLYLSLFCKLHPNLKLQWIILVDLNCSELNHWALYNDPVLCFLS